MTANHSEKAKSILDSRNDIRRPRGHSIADFKRMGLYLEAPSSSADDLDLEGGVVWQDLPSALRKRLSTVREDEDGSSVDYGVIKSLLEEGLNAADAGATFSASKRGKDAQGRKADYADYLQRTIRKAAARTITVDFSGVHEPSANRITKSGILEERTDLIEPQKTEWVWRPYIPAGRITILAGDPGLAKSQISIDLVSRISRNDAMPNANAAHAGGNCAIATAEDSTAETIVPRIIACRGNRRKIRVIRKVEMDGETRYLSLPRDLPTLRAYIEEHGIRMLVMDPLDAFLGKDTDTYKNHDVRLALSPLEEIAEQTGCAILVISHLNKKEDAATLFRISGSIGFIAAARSVLAVSRTKDSGMHVLYSIKSNLSRKPPALRYEIEGDKELGVSHVAWRGMSDFDPSRQIHQAEAPVATLSQP